MELPVSEREALFRAPDGSDDLAILEASGGAVERALAVLPRLARLTGPEEAQGPRPAGDGASWGRLTVTDFEAALLGLRRFLLGDVVACMFRCAAEACGERLELEFSIAAFLAETKPSMPARVARIAERAGWFALAGNREDEVRFRLPTVEDQLRALGRLQAHSVLVQRCIEAKRLPARTLTRVERAMEAMAPLVSRPLEGECPACGERMTMPLHVPTLVMDELTRSAVGVHDEIHAIAAAYHWDEATILAMPQSRRQAYAETIRRHKREAQ